MRTPGIFVSHGSPMMAIASNDFTESLARLRSHHPAPHAVAVVSAHWRTRTVSVTGARQPGTLHDFGGFPDELAAIAYGAPGQPALAQLIAARIGGVVDRERDLDHGVWVPLRHVFPRADVPIVQISLPASASPAALVDLGRQLAFLREEGVWLVGSGGIVHNLGRLSPEGTPPAEWARAFDRWIADAVAALDLSALTEYRTDAPYASLAAPTSEHLDPLFVVLGAARPGDRVETFHEGWELGSLSLRSFVLTDAPLRG